MYFCPHQIIFHGINTDHSTEQSDIADIIEVDRTEFNHTLCFKFSIFKYLLAEFGESIYLC